MKLWNKTQQGPFLEVDSVSFPVTDGRSLRDVLTEICRTSGGKLCFLVFTEEEEKRLRDFLKEAIGAFADYLNGKGPTDFLEAIVCSESRFEAKLPVFVSYINEDPNTPITDGGSQLRLAFWINYQPR